MKGSLLLATTLGDGGYSKVQPTKGLFPNLFFQKFTLFAGRRELERQFEQVMSKHGCEPAQMIRLAKKAEPILSKRLVKELDSCLGLLSNSYSPDVADHFLEIALDSGVNFLAQYNRLLGLLPKTRRSKVYQVLLQEGQFAQEICYNKKTLRNINDAAADLPEVIRPVFISGILNNTQIQPTAKNLAGIVAKIRQNNNFLTLQFLQAFETEPQTICADTPGYFKRAFASGSMVRATLQSENKKRVVYVKIPGVDLRTGNMLAYEPGSDTVYSVRIAGGNMALVEDIEIIGKADGKKGYFRSKSFMYPVHKQFAHVFEKDL